jgi:lipid A 3-O-deacylase
VARIAAILLFALMVFFPATSHAQSGPETGGNEIEAWTGGGKVLSGYLANVHVWNAGVRYGWILTDLHGSGWMRGRFEYAIDVMPVFWVIQADGIARGGGVNPIVLKWDFEQRRHVVPYFELSGGLIRLDRQMPYPGTSTLNWIPSGAIGLHFLRHSFNWSAEIRFLHASNANLGNDNPGINTFQLRVGIGRFTHPK